MNKSLPCVILFCLCSACSQQLKDKNTLDVVQGSGVFWQKHVNTMLDRCRHEVATIVLAKYEATGRHMTKEEVEKLDKSLMGSCVRYYRISV